MPLEVDSHSPEETARLGVRLGELLRAGDVVLLHGGLGAGKTALTQGIALGVGVPAERRVASPSFTIVNQHPGRMPLYHLDLYRIEDEGELIELGLDELLGGESDGAVVIEWGERLALPPPQRLEIEIAITGPLARRLTLTATGARGEAMLAALSQG